MDMLDPQVQVKLIEVAWKMVELSRIGESASKAQPIEENAKKFDEAYKAISKSVEA